MTDRTAADREDPYFPIYGDYAGRMPTFYDTSELSFTSTVEAAWPELRRELESVLRSPSTPFRTNWDPYDFRIQGWRSANLFRYTHPDAEALAAFPVAARVLTSIPHLTSAFVNMLEPRTKIPSHCGDSNTIWRCHLPLIVPREAERCGIEVGTERRSWQEGRMLAFCDAHRHWAWNDSDEARVVLVFDVMRPEYVADKPWICAMVMASIALTLAFTRAPALRGLPRPLLRAAHVVLGAVFRVRLALTSGRAGSARVSPARSGTGASSPDR